MNNNNIDGITEQTDKCTCDHCEQNNNIDSIMQKNINPIKVEDKQNDQTIIPVVQQLAT